MDNPQIELVPVLLAALAYLVIGYVWYSPAFFGKIWSQLSGQKMSGKSRKAAMLYGVIIALVTAYVLAFFIVFLGVTTVQDGLFVGFLAWLGFVATNQVGGVVWSHHPFKLFLVHTGCSFVTFLAMGGILAA